MQPTKQTILHDPENGVHGNCMSAVLASILHLPIEEIPIFSSSDWQIQLNNWLRKFGLAYLMVDAAFKEALASHQVQNLYHEIYGISKRSNDTLHACVGKDGELVFDPHPDNSGLTEVYGYGILILLNPWQHFDLQKDVSEWRGLAHRTQSEVDRLESQFELLQLAFDSSELHVKNFQDQYQEAKTELNKSVDQIENLTALINKLCRQVNKFDPANSAASEAATYMMRNNLLGTSLQNDEEGVAILDEVISYSKNEKNDADEKCKNL